MPEELVSRVELAADFTDQTIPEIVSEALGEHLQEVEADPAFKRELIERSLDDEIDEAVLGRALGRRDAEAVLTATEYVDGSDHRAAGLADGSSQRLVADTSGLVSLELTGFLDRVLADYAVHTTERVIRSVRQQQSLETDHGLAAKAVYADRTRMTVHKVSGDDIQLAYLNDDQESCLALESTLRPAYLLSDDLRALPELQAMTSATVVITPTVLRALVDRDAITATAASEGLSVLAAHRRWLGEPLYRRARQVLTGGSATAVGDSQPVD
jgi:hypothetical protein